MRESRHRERLLPTRRRLLQLAGATAMASLLPMGRSYGANDLTGRLAAYTLVRSALTV